MKEGDTILVKTYGLHEGWVGSREVIFLANLDDETTLVEIPEFRNKGVIGGLWKVKKTDIIGEKAR
jgi:hypothetical protein